MLALCALSGSLYAQVNVLTANYDSFRTNSTNSETVLQHSNVNPNQFGKLYSLQVDGQVFAQPLYVSGVDVPGYGQRNILVVATMHNSVYAFDAAAPPTSPPLWKVNLGTPVPSANYSIEYYYTDISPEVGILSTPVIDASTNTIYVVAATYSDRAYSFKLHGLDLATGVQVAGGPATISGEVPGVGSDNKDGVVPFIPFAHIQRPALLLHDGVVYVGFGSHGDSGIYHGWLFGYSAANLSQQVSVLNASPDGEGSSLWMTGHGPSVDEDGNIYVATANGAFDGKRNLGQSFLKLDKNLGVLDTFTPDNWEYLNDVDNDLGSTTPLPLPGTDLLIGGGKEGVLYVIKRGNMGQMSEGNPQAVQSFRIAEAGLYNMAYWNRPGAPLLFVQGFGAPVRAYQLKDGKFDTTPVNESVNSGGIPFLGMTVSSNQDDPSTAILWTTTTDGGNVGRPWPGVFHAFDASDLTQELWNSDMVAGDMLPSFAKFANPTVANGRVYMPTFSNQIAVYGLRAGGNNGLSEITVANAFSMQGGAVSPGELVAVTGDGIGPATAVEYKPDDTSTGALPQILGGVRVLFDDQPASIIYASSTKALAVVPYSVIGKSSVSVTLQHDGLTTEPQTLEVVDAHPGIATVDGSGVGAGAFDNEDATPNSPENPAYPSTTIAGLITGVGVTDPQNDSIDETFIPFNFPLPKLTVTASIGGVDADVLYAGGKPGLLGPVLYVRIHVPDQIQPGSAVPLVIRVGEFTSRAVTVSIAGDGAASLTTNQRVVPNRQFAKQ
jgi:uncharacterized protein (TIGR03437 family)